MEFGVLEPSASETKETEQKGMGGGGGTSFLPTTLEYSHHAPAETGAERTGAEERLPPEEAPHCAWRSCVMVWTLGCSPPTPPLASESSELGISQLQTQEMWVHSLGQEDSQRRE